MKVSLRRTLAALVLFGVSFGYVEASIVVYLRTIGEPLRQRFHPGVPASELFPLLTWEQVNAANLQSLLTTELARELATLLLLAAAGLLVSRQPGECLAAFLIAFGVWDIAFYVFLKALIDWPASLLTWDLLFLIPVPWSGPVLAPVFVALTMIVCGATHLNRPFPLRAPDWVGFALGGVILTAAFCWDWRNLASGGLPNPFPWWLFTLGETVAVTAFAASRLRSQSGSRAPQEPG